MIRVGGVVAVLAGLGSAGLLWMQIHRLGFDEHVDTFDDLTCTFRGRGFWIEKESDLHLMTTPPSFPPTMPSRLLRFTVDDTELDSELIGVLRLPEDVQGRAFTGAEIELRHEWLELPLLGAVAGRTLLRIGGTDWTDGAWRLRGAIVGIALLPLALWALASIPFLLLRKRARPQA